MKIECDSNVLMKLMKQGRHSENLHTKKKKKGNHYLHTNIYLFILILFSQVFPLKDITISVHGERQT